ncbi:hypothetical protein [Cupriavidus campinensis]
MKVVAALLLFFATSAHATEALVMTRNQQSKGVIAQEEMLYALLVNDPCMLPIANAKNLRMAAIFNNPKKPDVGCWGRTLSPTKAEVVIIGPYGNTDEGNLLNFVKVKLDANGAGKVLGPAMSREEFEQNIKKYHDSLR